MRRALALLLTGLMVLLLLPGNVLAADDARRTGLENQWMTTDGREHPTGNYVSDKQLERLPVTMEAWVYIPQAVYDRVCGTIIGNYAMQRKPSFTFSIQAAGVPQLTIGYNGGDQRYLFSTVSVPPDTWTHVAVVRDADSQMIHCFLNGQLMESTMPEMWGDMPEDGLLDMLCLAGDRREMNKNGFRGMLGQVALYGDLRIRREVQQDMENGPDLQDPELLTCYDLWDARFGETIPDASGNGYDMRYERLWLTQQEMDEILEKDDKDYTYSLAFLPDIQYTTELYPERLDAPFDYLLENKEAKNIRYLITLGDLTNANTETEWRAIRAQTEKLSGKLPYSLIRGNHDIYKTGAQPLFDRYYGAPGTAYYAHVQQNGGFYSSDSAANTYLLFRAGEVDYLILNLDFGAEDAVLSWADDVLRQYADRRVIVVTHGYLQADGTRLAGNQEYAPSTYRSALNDGDDLWDKLLRRHENVAMVVCGHMSQDRIIHSIATGDNGNIVHQLLMDTQGSDKLMKGLGIVTLMEFTEDGRYARVCHYSTVHDLYFLEANTRIALDFGAGTQTETPDVADMPLPVLPEEAKWPLFAIGAVAFAALALTAALLLAKSKS